MSTTTLSMKEQLAPVVASELRVINEGATTFGIGQAKKVFVAYPSATFDDVYDHITKQNDGSAAAVLSGLISARTGVPISFLVPMQDDLAQVWRNFEVADNTELMFGRLVALKARLADEASTALRASIADGSLAQAKTAALVKSLGNLKTKGVQFTEEEKAAILAAL
jgi:hypothetical protein